jgi:hypothetical protein
MFKISEMVDCMSDTEEALFRNSVLPGKKIKDVFFAMQQIANADEIRYNDFGYSKLSNAFYQYYNNICALMEKNEDEEIPKHYIAI